MSARRHWLLEFPLARRVWIMGLLLLVKVRGQVHITPATNDNRLSSRIL